MLHKTAILGPGLLGGSLALALSPTESTVSVWGRRQAPLDVLGSRCDHLRLSTSLDTVIDGAGLIVLATPIGVMPDLIAQILASNKARPDAIITDVGSVKGPLVSCAEEILSSSSLTFIGSHPMAGSEASGVDAARAALFAGAMCLLTPTESTPPEAVDFVRRFWQSLACTVHQLTPQEHDRIVGHVSHVPHLLSSLIVDCALAQDPTWAKFAGQGLIDTTRIASGEPHMWTEILMENHETVIDAVQHGQETLTRLIGLLRGGEKDALYRFLMAAKALRDTHIVPSKSPGTRDNSDGKV